MGEPGGAGIFDGDGGGATIRSKVFFPMILGLGGTVDGGRPAGSFASAARVFSAGRPGLPRTRDQ